MEQLSLGLSNQEEGTRLFEEVHALPRLALAWKKVRANGGSAGPDGESVEQFDEHLSDNLAKLEAELKSCRYQPGPVRRVSIPKPNSPSGGERHLGIATVQVHYTFIQQQFGIGPNYSSLPSTEGAEFPCSQKSALWRQRDSDFAELSGWQFCSALGVDGSAGASTRGIAHRSTGSR